MAINEKQVREIFEGLETGDGAAFFAYVADNVDWIVEGTHPLAGHYLSKEAFIDGTFTKLDQILPQGTELNVEHVLVSGDWAVVELHSLATAKNGFRFDNRYCWVCRFAAGRSWRFVPTSIRLSSRNSFRKIRCPRRTRPREPRSRRHTRQKKTHGLSVTPAIRT